MLWFILCPIYLFYITSHRLHPVHPLFFPSTYSISLFLLCFQIFSKLHIYFHHYQAFINPISNSDYIKRDLFVAYVNLLNPWSFAIGLSSTFSAGRSFLHKCFLFNVSLLQRWRAAVMKERLADSISGLDSWHLSPCFSPLIWKAWESFGLNKGFKFCVSLLQWHSTSINTSALITCIPVRWFMIVYVIGASYFQNLLGN